jgi:Predicted transcriptional regulator
LIKGRKYRFELDSKIIAFLEKEGPQRYSQFYKRLKEPRMTVLDHLKKLVDSGLVCFGEYTKEDKPVIVLSNQRKSHVFLSEHVKHSYEAEASRLREKMSYYDRLASEIIKLKIEKERLQKMIQQSTESFEPIKKSL